ncbi:MAG: hypothetical protein V7776_23135, partial [Halopseudomonas aestusnigri]
MTEHVVNSEIASTLIDGMTQEFLDNVLERIDEFRIRYGDEAVDNFLERLDAQHAQYDEDIANTDDEAIALNSFGGNGFSAAQKVGGLLWTAGRILRTQFPDFFPTSELAGRIGAARSDFINAHWLTEHISNSVFRNPSENISGEEGDEVLDGLLVFDAVLSTLQVGTALSVTSFRLKNEQLLSEIKQFHNELHTQGVEVNYSEGQELVIRDSINFDEVFSAHKEFLETNTEDFLYPINDVDPLLLEIQTDLQEENDRFQEVFSEYHDVLSQIKNLEKILNPSVDGFDLYPERSRIRNLLSDEETKLSQTIQYWERQNGTDYSQNRDIDIVELTELAENIFSRERELNTSLEELQEIREIYNSTFPDLGPPPTSGVVATLVYQFNLNQQNWQLALSPLPGILYNKEYQVFQNEFPHRLAVDAWNAYTDIQQPANLQDLITIIASIRDLGTIEDRVNSLSSQLVNINDKIDDLGGFPPGPNGEVLSRAVVEEDLMQLRTVFQNQTEDLIDLARGITDIQRQIDVHIAEAQLLQPELLAVHTELNRLNNNEGSYSHLNGQSGRLGALDNGVGAVKIFSSLGIAVESGTLTPAGLAETVLFGGSESLRSIVSGLGNFSDGRFA